MEGTEISVLMLSTCISGTLLYSRDSPLNNLALSPSVRSLLMGTAVAITAFLVITSPLGRRSGAHMNPAITGAFFWLGRVHRWDAAFYVAAHFLGAVVGVLVARKILGMQLSAPPVQYLMTVPGMYGSPAALLAVFALSAVLMGVVLYSSNHRGLQCKPCQELRIRSFCLDVARNLDLFCGPRTQHAHSSSDLCQAYGVEQCLLREDLPRPAVDMSVSLPF